MSKDIRHMAFVLAKIKATNIRQLGITSDMQNKAKDPFIADLIEFSKLTAEKKVLNQYHILLFQEPSTIEQMTNGDREDFTEFRPTDRQS